ncbi:spore germination protein KA [Anaerovirgula multivorans]|uniref:Spore germination protein KA n=1 Tax=Anaerovirgula multivorans TaxID=312168 RepID=A0A239IWV9_9FIRM|nr:spore germination protein [Anaerovirgula multivorans]SNS96914.1 spore germination protein KA [Anaerovirgula multivorans]
MGNYLDVIKNLILFKEPERKETFTLQETSFDENQKENEKTVESNKRPTKELEVQRKHNDLKVSTDEEKNMKKDKLKISKKLSENLAYIKKIYRIPTNADVVIRKFKVVVKDMSVNAFMIFIDGMTNTKVIDDNILQPLMLLSNLDIKTDDLDIAKYIESHLITHNQIKATKKFVDVIDEVNFGGCGVFVDGLDVAFAADVKGWLGRSVGPPNTEITIRGPQEGFVEALRPNTGLVRKILKDEDLIVESASIGKKSKTPVSILYIKDIANDSLVEEVRRRLNNIHVDNILDSGELEQLIEDVTILPIPQTIATERPDRVASMLTEGKVALIMHGSPFALIVPCTLPELFHSPEDSYMRFPYVNLLRFMRVVGMIVALLLPGTYIAITSYHYEMIPTDLLMSITATREIVPFPAVIELLLMEFAFELIREAGIRIPGPIGPTLGIVAGLVLGQAAVAANIVSPIMIIVVAIAGVGSFTIPNFSLAFAFRILKFGYILLGAMAGFLGIAIGLFLQGLWFLSAKSFGVSMFSPIGPVTSLAFYNDFTRVPIWKQEKRPDFLNTKEITKQPKISRKWLNKKSGDGDDNGE